MRGKSPEGSDQSLAQFGKALELIPENLVLDKQLVPGKHQETAVSVFFSPSQNQSFVKFDSNATSFANNTLNSLNPK